MQWNNTGVYKNFACAAGQVSIPEGVVPEAQEEDWSVYAITESVIVIAYSTEKLGIIAVFEDADSQVVFEKVLAENSDYQKLKSFFKFPNGSLLEYDVQAKKDQWVMISEDGQVLDRNFDSWPLIEGDL